MNLGSNGHWVRTRTEEGAKAFMAEQRAESERRNRRDDASPLISVLALLVLVAVVVTWALL